MADLRSSERDSPQTVVATVPSSDGTVAPVRPSTLEAFGLLAADVFAGFAPLVIVALIEDLWVRDLLGLAFLETRLLREWGFPIAILISSAGLLAVVYWVSVRGRPKGWRAFGFTSPSLRGLLATVAVVMALILAQSGVLSLVPAEWVGSLDTSLRPSLPQTGTGAWLLFALVALIAAPLAEECVFRGVLFRWFRTWSGFWVGGVLSSLLFATMHLYIVSPGGFVGGVLTTTVFAAGLGFCWLLERYRCLTLCVLGHALYNGTLLAIS